MPSYLMKKLLLSLVAGLTAGAALASAIMGFPLMVRAIRLSIAAIDQRLEVAARTLGGSRLWVFVSITLPLALPGIITGTLLSFARGLGEFGATIMFAGQFMGRTQTMPLAIYAALESDLDAALGLSMLLLAISFGLLVFFRRWLSQASYGVS